MRHFAGARLTTAASVLRSDTQANKTKAAPGILPTAAFVWSLPEREPL
ncbi:hypothetical protein H6A60_05765 [Sutterella massiliensis]|uniref:Uncharacterized protein n=1 Tax=Sutterella massiliensis TaxID=1816689 RepID=A0ABS2DRQ2_9BURK|nr:hypothetical protein [Sutterella massiliensis]MBM6703991.1 hypothetical protein [Sutterella massiliensis]